MERRFQVVLCSKTADWFREDESFNIRYDFPTGESAFLIFKTNWANEGYEATVPRLLLVEAHGTANSLDAAMTTFRAAADNIGVMIAFAANAAWDPFAVEVAFDTTDGKERHEYFQNFIPAERGIPKQGRRPDPDATLKLIQAIGSHPSGNRLGRAVAQYAHALSLWFPGEEAEAVSHLWMGIESLTTFAVEAEITRHAVADKQELATTVYGLRPRVDEDFVRDYEISGHVRRSIIFQGDTLTHRLAKDASDGLEHGYLDFSVVHSNAREVRNKVASYLREAVLTLSGIDDQALQALQDSRFSEPLAAHAMSWYLRGHLIGTTEALLSETLTPIMRWHIGMSAVVASESEEDKYRHMKVESSATAMLPAGVQFQPGSIEAWGPSGSTMTLVSTDCEASEAVPSDDTSHT